MTPAAERAWYDELRLLLESAYLAGDNPRAQSGFSRDEAAWERARRVILDAVDRDGTFLDVGCASGYLMESLVGWATAKGLHLEPYGLDFSDRLATLARSRLPQWADRIFVSNALEWRPPHRFDYVRTELVYVPEHRQRELVQRLFDDVLLPGGRLIVCSYGSSRRPQPNAEPLGELLRGWGHEVKGEAAAREINGRVVTYVAWIDRW